jgi:hypothetical protein
VLCQHRLDCLRPHVLAAGDDQLTDPALDDELTVGVEVAGVAGREPTVDEWRRAVAVAAEHHRAPDVHLPGRDPNLDTIERDAVVHHAAAGLGHAVRRHHVGRQPARRFGATEQDLPEA